jgi:hypothetical protein
MSFFDGITQQETAKKGYFDSFSPSLDTSPTITPKTPPAPVSSQPAPIFKLPTSVPNPLSGIVATKTSGSTPLFSTQSKIVDPSTLPRVDSGTWFDKLSSPSGPLPTKPEQTQTQAPSYFDRMLQNKEVISASPAQTKSKEIYDKYAPKVIKDVVNQISEGLYGQGQVVDFAGNLKEDTGLLGGLFGSVKSNFARVDDRYQKLVDAGVSPDRATQISTQYTKNVLSDPLARFHKKAVQDTTLKNLNLTPEENSALRSVGFFEALNQGLDALNFTGIGSIEKTVASKIAEETSPRLIKDLLIKNVRNIPTNLAEDLSYALSKVKDPKEVESILGKVDFSINKYTPNSLPETPTAETPTTPSLIKSQTPSAQKIEPVGFGKEENPIPEVKSTSPKEQEKTKEEKAPVFKGFSDLSTNTLQKLEGRSTVSKQFISDLTNSPDLKQTERDIIREKLSEYPDGSNIPVKEFADKVKGELLPLKVKSNSEGMNPNYDEYSGSNSTRYENVSLPEETRGNVKNYKENVYESPIKTSAGNTHFSGNTNNYFGHTRIEDMADNSTRRVIEVQSDLYQKGNLEKEGMVKLTGLTPEQHTKMNSLGSIDEKNVYIKSIQGNLPNKISKLQQYNNPTAHFRMVREEIKKASEDGKTKLQFPTGETAMKIEGLGSNTLWQNSDLSYIKPESLEVGKTLIQGHPDNIRAGQWTITEVLGDGKFKAVPADQLRLEMQNVDYSGKPRPGGAISQEEAIKRLSRLNETFDISGKVDTNNPIYKFYEKDLGRYLTNKYGAKVVTDPKGVKWYEVNVKPEEAKKPVTAFSKPKVNTGITNLSKIGDLNNLPFNTLVEKGPEIFAKFFNPDEISVLFPKGLIDGGSFGQVTIRALQNPLIKVVQNNGLIQDKVAYEEAFHVFINKFLSPEEKAIIFKNVEKNPLTRPGFYGRKNLATMYDKGQVTEEFIAHDFADFQHWKNLPKEKQTIFQKIIQMIKDWIRKLTGLSDVYKKMEFKDRGYVRKENRQLKPISMESRVGSPGEYDKPLTKEEKLAKARESLVAGEKKYGAKPYTPMETNGTYQILSNSREDRLLIEKSLKEMARISKRESYLESLKIKLPQDLQQQAQALIFRKEALDENPLKRLVKYMARRGEFKGGLPEVTGKGKSIFATRGDSIITEATGLKDSESARQAFSDYIDKRKQWESDMAQYQRNKQSFLSDARGKRDEKIANKTIDSMANRSERHINELLGDKQKREERIKKAIEKEKETQAKLKAQEESVAKYAEMVNKAHLDANVKENLITKFKAVFSPISQTDPVTKQIYFNWETSKLTAKEDANKVYEQYKAKPNNDLPSIHDYENGAQTPWIRNAFDDLYSEAKNAGLNLYYKENYIPHVYNEKPEVIKKAVVKYMEDQKVAKEIVDQFKETGEIPEVIAIRLKIRPNFQKIRTFDDYKTAMDYGLTPKFNTVAEHLAYYREEMGKTLANQKLIDDLIANGKLLDAYDAPESWVEVKLPGRMRRTYYGQKNLAESLNGQFRDEENLSFSQVLFKRVAGASKLMQEIKLSAGLPGTNINFFSIGQAIKMLTTGVGDLAKLDLKGANTSLKASTAFLRANFNGQSIKWLKSNQKYIDLMAKNNINLVSRVDDYSANYKQWKSILTKQTLKEGINSLKQVGSDLKDVRDVKTLGKAFSSLFDSRAMGISGQVFDKLFNEKTFTSMMPQMQIQVFKDLYEQALKSGMPEETASQFAGGIVKNEFGLINDLGRTQNVKDVFNSVFFAPRFREGIVNTFINAGKSYSNEFKNTLFQRNRSLVLGMIITYVAYNYLNKQLNGNDMIDNEPGHEADLRIPLPNGNIVYTSFMPSTLSFVRNIASAGINFAEGRNAVALQKAGTIFSMPIKTASEVVANSDYFGRPIYDVTDSALVKAQKAITYMGLTVTHPYFSELYKYFKGQQNIYQTISMMTELPLKFSTEEKSAIAKHYQDKQNKTDLNAQERANISSMVNTYDNVQKLKAEGNIGAIETIINGLSDKEYQQYQIIMKYDQIQGLKKNKQSAEAKSIGDTLTEEEYKQYQAIKTIRTSQKIKETNKQKIQKATKPAFDTNTKLDERTLMESVKVYANAIGTDPVTAFNRIFTNQKIRRVDNGAIIVERVPFLESVRIKKDRNATPDLILDHTIPLQIGGDNSDNNLKLVPRDVWASYTPVENHLGQLLKSALISKDEAQSLITKFKNGDITSQDILKL